MDDNAHLPRPVRGDTGPSGLRLHPSGRMDQASAGRPVSGISASVRGGHGGRRFTDLLLIGDTGMLGLAEDPAAGHDRTPRRTLLVCVAARAEWRLDGERLLPACGSIILFPHGMRPERDGPPCDGSIVPVRPYVADLAEGCIPPRHLQAGGNPQVGLLSACAANLLPAWDGMSGSLRLATRHYLGQLAAAILEPAARDDGPPPFAGVKAARLRAVIADIAAHLNDPDLSAAGVGRRLGFGERYVQMLVDGLGLSFSQYVRQERLEDARARLCDPRLGDRRVAEIAFEVGFQDLSYFNREFRRRFGHTPTDARKAA